MKRRMRTKLIVLLMAILSLFVFAGCSMGESLDEALATRDLTAQVTYYANGGFGGSIKDFFFGDSRDNSGAGSDVRYCPHCGYPIVDDFDYCPKCGKPLK